MRATGDTVPFHAVVVPIAGAAWRFVGVATALPRGSAIARVINQDSRSAVKARSFDPLRGSFGERRCTSRKAGVSGLARGRHVGLSASSREGTPLKAAPIVVCARTSLAVTTRKPAPCVHATASRHVGLQAPGSRHTSGAMASRRTHRLLAAISGWGSDEGRRRLRCSAGAGRLGAALDRDWERGDHRHEQNDDAP